MTPIEEEARKIVKGIFFDKRDEDYACGKLMAAITQALEEARREERERCARVAENVFKDERTYGSAMTFQSMIANQIRGNHESTCE